MSVGFWQLLVILFIILALFGGAKLSQGLGDLGKGMRLFFDGFKNSEKNKDEYKDDDIDLKKK